MPHHTFQDDYMTERIKSVLFWLGMEVSAADAVRVIVAMTMGGLLAFYIQVLYRRYSASTSSKDAISSSFPLLTIVTVVVISVVKSSLALSLGLVGALSIVRFRAAIKDPVELVYLFLCIALGLALGAGKIVAGFSLVFVASLFILGQHFLSGTKQRQNLLLTVSGDADGLLQDPERGALSIIQQSGRAFALQRCDVRDGRATLRVTIRDAEATETVALVESVRRTLPGCDVSYINMDAVL